MLTKKEGITGIFLKKIAFSPSVPLKDTDFRL
jgi:hypothetical protein